MAIAKARRVRKRRREMFVSLFILWFIVLTGISIELKNLIVQAGDGFFYMNIGELIIASSGINLAKSAACATVGTILDDVGIVEVLKIIWKKGIAELAKMIWREGILGVVKMIWK